MQCKTSLVFGKSVDSVIEGNIKERMFDKETIFSKGYIYFERAPSTVFSRRKLIKFVPVKRRLKKKWHKLRLCSQDMFSEEMSRCFIDTFLSNRVLSMLERDVGNEF